VINTITTGSVLDTARTPPPIQALGDPLLPGIPEQPDVPPDLG
jgi:hypothetical protein